MEQPYLLLTPGPLTTTSSVKEVMLKDWCTWDSDYKDIVQSIRSRLLQLGQAPEEEYTAVLIQGSGTFGVEAVIGTAVPDDGKLLILANGAYGERIQEIARVLGIRHRTLEHAPDELPGADQLDALLKQDTLITHVAFVHCETTTGILNPLEALVQVIKNHGKIAIVDAMSSFGGTPIAVAELGIDYLVSSANKCIQGVPGFSFVISRKSELIKCKGRARSLSLDLFDQWQVMDNDAGKWRFTSPTHVVRAFYQALLELEEEGGVEQRCARYTRNQQTLVRFMEQAGFKAHLPAAVQSPFITTFEYPDLTSFTFEAFYRFLKEKGFVIYPGKLSKALVFRIGTIGDVHIEDIERLCEAAASYLTTLRLES
ncbi:2-aminoethylphosphonate--pyruvate transaminase [Paenibacillus sp. P46E]|uniref:2-aminoethylphosphonate--pyruvate transaminase n=1 Tax=Paenibacillus sp. P46E TaxID=1349436 RepID=UPI00093A96BA|nr:2-aminoethylphosphonate--pyruvate transaminase [Paenibacillus sp. P46E]OKP99628.1 2-aminoethylphosphonate--pyruvate transaminase [Paenibacillus sp. P46E]